ncbi:hypothetical protein SAMN05444266_106460 [Chitinophaga jiangningensis]|uniref:Uncharacterized protein n=1 Tax=Chitinophaga jiangningensis TaxID=1419482 RepID=A0A1M7G9Y0_9BACT|nr:hypothetical protein [Chitinophaga jiangningensis]SHM12925.1 hypothetical protein SAMN05444266_106460 [Chitinophaga jiangningensis]
MKSIKPTKPAEPMPLPRPRNEMHVFDQILWDQRRMQHAAENGIPFSQLADIPLVKPSFNLSGYESMDELRRNLLR